MVDAISGTSLESKQPFLDQEEKLIVNESKFDSGNEKATTPKKKSKPDNNGVIWSQFNSRFGSKTLPVQMTRKMSLKEVREIILDTFIAYQKEFSRSSQEIKGLQAVLFDVIDHNYVIQEVIHKVSFEFLTACEEYRTKHAVSLVIILINNQKRISLSSVSALKV